MESFKSLSKRADITHERAELAPGLFFPPLVNKVQQMLWSGGFVLLDFVENFGSILQLILVNGRMPGFHIGQGR